MKNRIITISREFGSGGRTIGREVASKLSIPCGVPVMLYFVRNGSHRKY